MRKFVTADVFTDRAFAGNQLAVVLDGEGLSTERMQAIAREFNFSETTFVLPPEHSSSTAKVRIFTPLRELPFAGHPNVGTAYVLAHYWSELASAERLVFEEEAGLVDVRLIRDANVVVGAEITAPDRLSVGGRVDLDRLAASLSIGASDFRTTVHEPTIASVGLPFVIAEVRSRKALRRCQVDTDAFWRLLPLEGCAAVFLYSRTERSELPPSRVDARMFFDGPYEDPATGSAAAAFIAFLAAIAADEDLETRCQILQGEDMGRPSYIDVTASKRGGQVALVKIAGHAVEVTRGTLHEGLG